MYYSKSRRDDRRHRYGRMIAAHRKEWIAFAFKQVTKPHHADMTDVSAIFKSASSEDAARKAVTSLYKSKKLHVRWVDAVSMVWKQTGYASVHYMHEFLTGKSYRPRMAPSRSIYSARKSGSYSQVYAFASGADSPQYHTIYSKQGDEEIDTEPGDVGDAISSWDEYVATYLGRPATDVKIVRMSDQEKVQIMKTIQQGQDEGISLREIGMRIDDLMADGGEWWESRGSTIARTEANSAMNMASLEDAKVAVPGFVKTWSCAFLPKSRYWHMDMDGESVALEDTFTVEDGEGGTDDMQGPGDPDASAGNIINCVCTLLYEPPEGE